MTSRPTIATLRYGGFGLIEVVVSIAIASVLLLLMSGLVVETKRIHRGQIQALQAQMFAREAVEISKDLERSNYLLLASVTCTNASPCHPEAVGTAWQLFAGAESLQNLFSRSVVVESLCRVPDPSTYPNTIDETCASGVLDPNTKKITAQVTWNDTFGAKTVTLSHYAYAEEL